MSRKIHFAVVATVFVSLPVWAGGAIECKAPAQGFALSLGGGYAQIVLAGKKEKFAVVDVTDPHEQSYTEYQSSDGSDRFHFFDADGGGFTVTYDGVEYSPECTYPSDRR
jgi:hypothetical protein